MMRFLKYASGQRDRQTDRQTNTLIAMLYSPTVVVGFAFTAQPHSTVLSGKSFPLPTPA